MTVCGAQSFLKSFEKTSRVRRKPREVSGAKAMGRGLVFYDSGCGLALSATGLVGHRRASKRQGVQVRAGGPELNEIESFSPGIHRGEKILSGQSEAQAEASRFRAARDGMELWTCLSHSNCY